MQEINGGPLEGSRGPTLTPKGGPAVTTAPVSSSGYERARRRLRGRELFVRGTRAPTLTPLINDPLRRMFAGQLKHRK